MNFLRQAYHRTRAAVSASRRHAHYDRLQRSGLSPFVCVSNAPISLAEARARLTGPHLIVPNLSGFYHGTLIGYWERHGLGSRCLLISETHAVGAVFSQRYPATQFVTTDYFVDLQPHPTCDVVWDVCAPSVPAPLSGCDSIICQATMEHINDPVQVMRNFASILSPGGMLYVQTHTPAFHYHAWPKDYLRYFPEWFQDITITVPALKLVELLCVDGHAFAAYQKY